MCVYFLGLTSHVCCNTWYPYRIFSHFVVCVKPTLETYGITIGYSKSEDAVDISADDLKFDDLLADPEGLASFSSHLVREFSTENIEFWKACQVYKSIPPDNTIELIERAKALLSEYVLEASINQVNLPSTVRKALESDIQCGNITTNLFDHAAFEIKFLMSKDSFSRYKKGNICAKYVKEMRERLLAEYRHSGRVGQTPSAAAARAASIEKANKILGLDQPNRRGSNYHGGGILSSLFSPSTGRLVIFGYGSDHVTKGCSSAVSPSKHLSTTRATTTNRDINKKKKSSASTPPSKKSTSSTKSNSHSNKGGGSERSRRASTSMSYHRSTISEVEEVLNPVDVELEDIVTYNIPANDDGHRDSNKAKTSTSSLTTKGSNHHAVL